MEEIKKLKEVRRLYILKVYEAKGNNSLHTAKALGISIRSLQRFLRSEGFAPKQAMGHVYKKGDPRIEPGIRKGP
jgi:transposase